MGSDSHYFDGSNFIQGLPGPPGPPGNLTYEQIRVIENTIVNSVKGDKGEKGQRGRRQEIWLVRCWG